MIEYQLHHQPDTGQWLEFSDPVATIVAYQPDQVIPALQALQTRVDTEQLHAAGWVSYGAASGLDSALTARLSVEQPLLKFSLYRQPRVLDQLPVQLRDHVDPTNQTEGFSSQTKFQLGGFDPDAHCQAVNQIKSWLHSGDSYQVNYTQQLSGRWRSEIGRAHV